MPRTNPFGQKAYVYDQWFEENPLAYRSELQAIRALQPDFCSALEVGVGTGRFAGPLGVVIGVEPSRSMADLARRHGIEVVEAIAEDLPFVDAAFDLTLMVTTICFLDDIGKAFDEAYRVTATGGSILVGYLDRESKIGGIYEKERDKSDFYRWATFYSSEEVMAKLTKAGFCDLKSVQTIFSTPGKIQVISRIEPNYGAGLFVVVRGRKPLV